MGAPGEQAGARGLDPGSHTVQLSREKASSGEMSLKGVWVALGPQPGLGPSTQAQVPRLSPGAGRVSLKEGNSGSLNLPGTWAK